MVTTKKIIESFLFLIGILFLTQGCTKKCQPPATEKFKTVTGQEWRLVETTDTDPNFETLSNTTFLIFKFEKDYSGAVNKVLNNRLYDTPIRTFEFNINSADQRLVIAFSDLGAAASGDGTDPTATQSAEVSTVNYSYELNRGFEMTNESTGAFYRFVPYTGIVDPDNQCEF